MLSTNISIMQFCFSSLLIMHKVNDDRSKTALIIKGDCKIKHFHSLSNVVYAKAQK